MTEINKGRASCRCKWAAVGALAVVRQTEAQGWRGAGGGLRSAEQAEAWGRTHAGRGGWGAVREVGRRRAAEEHPRRRRCGGRSACSGAVGGGVGSCATGLGRIRRGTEVGRVHAIPSAARRSRRARKRRARARARRRGRGSGRPRTGRNGAGRSGARCGDEMPKRMPNRMLAACRSAAKRPQLNNAGGDPRKKFWLPGLAHRVGEVAERRPPRGPLRGASITQAKEGKGGRVSVPRALGPSGPRTFWLGASGGSEGRRA